MRARYYSPILCRFISEDSVVGSLDKVGSLNRYAFCGGNPVKYVDPTGNQATDAGTVTGKDKSISEVLYGDKEISSKLTAGFDGYSQTQGRHEGIDFQYSRTNNANNIYSLIEGVVINVKKSNNGLTTVAIYDEKENKTVVYLHSNPSVKVGDVLYVGSLIGTESNNGASAVHTHIEVVNGRAMSAKPSSDSVLTNEDPTEYWKNKGYTIK